jgi:hypothetical protein
VEGDFFNGPSQAVGGGGNPFRLRFAFVDYGYFRIGQQNTVFMDSNSFPMTVDFAGPRGLVNLRRPSARVTIPVGEQLFWATGIEQPFSDITTNGIGTGFQDVPDIATHLRWQGDRGHVQISGLGRAIGYSASPTDDTLLGGWGFNGTTNFHPWAYLLGTDPVHEEDPSGLTRSRILLQYTFGWGIARYIQDTAGLGLDGQVDPFTGDFDTLYATGWTATYEHWYSAHWLSNFTYSQVDTESFAGQPASTYESADYLAASLWWIPVVNLSIGTEYLYGERVNINSDQGAAHRINALVQYNF